MSLSTTSRLAPLRLLLLGDSLTSGWLLTTEEEHPYSTALTRHLTQAFPQREIETVVSGVPGDTVVGGFMQGFARRLKKRLDEATTEGRLFNWTVILGGTNDLGAEVPIEDTFSTLKELYSSVLAHNPSCGILCCQVPECSPVFVNLAQQRDALNELIRTHATTDPLERLHYFPTSTFLPLKSATPEFIERYWAEDKLHFTAEGYDLLGASIAETIEKLEKRKVV
ncbi:SGNH hydrolase [Gonapodya prolifera JEL478]|uniref:SGNH hydrolase n=1 Tax=Gonapodya prolifera (strain JEL478) TaxID=1344416 RepID=A0A139AIN9_GONPJ|nr:SGNH hydrolase [Gonapodya prolifera JEL478]|eukprot:KXS16671.1 SGNH hydrolase [Gonapodya prolifera JEL478]